MMGWIKQIPLHFKAFWNNLDISWQEGLFAWGGYRLLLTALNYFVWYQTWLPQSLQNKIYIEQVGGIHSALELWKRWDTVHYLKLITQGYREGYLSVFFPLYPMLVRGLYQISGIDPLLLGLILSSLFSLLAIVCLHRFIREVFSLEKARLTVGALLLCPYSLFLFAVYPHSLSFLLVILSLWGTYRQKWLWASLAGLAAGLTHGSIFPLALAMGWEIVVYLRSQRRYWLRDLALLALPCLPILGMASYLAWRIWMGYPDYLQLQQAGWGRIACYPWVPVMRLFLQLPEFFRTLVSISLLFDTCGLFIQVCFLVWAVRKLPFSWVLFQAGMLLSLLSTTTSGDPIMSFNRLSLIVFPLYVLWAHLAENRWLRRLGVAAGLFLSILFNIVFLLGYWVG
jgi:hypothetical protein